MRKLLLGIVFVLLCSVAWADLKVGIIGDQTGADDLSQAYSVLKTGAEALSDKKLDLVLHVGDIVESKSSDSQIEVDFKKAVGYLNCIRKTATGGFVPWYAAAGDHDVSPVDFVPGSKDYSKRDLFKSLLNSEYKTRTPRFSIKKLYYSFDYKGYHFICLFAEDTLCVDPRWGNIFMDKISNDQFRWLKDDIRKSAGSKGIVVFVHQPMWYNWTGWRKVHNLLRKYSVIAVIAGHFHYNQDEGMLDGIRYLVVGSTGGTVKNASCNGGNLHHVTIMTIDNSGSIGFQLIPLDTENTREEFTKRKNMDRIQAIDAMLSSYMQTKQGTKSGALLKYTGSQTNSGDDPLRANPIDIPVNVYIQKEEGGDWSLYASRVKPGIGVWLSNLSSVTLQNNNLPSGVTGVKLEFQANNQLFWVEKVLKKANSIGQI